MTGYCSYSRVVWRSSSGCQIMGTLICFKVRIAQYIVTHPLHEILWNSRMNELPLCIRMQINIIKVILDLNVSQLLCSTREPSSVPLSGGHLGTQCWVAVVLQFYCTLQQRKQSTF